ncbi:MAG TPA: hypothetical protein VGL60_00295 [Acidimicrobiales bacterium]|jgi:hypothetical protein
MQVNGIQVTFLDIPPEYTEEYNRWYDLDHMPEHVSKADVLMGRRYVAPRSMRGLPASLVGEAFGGHPPYLSLYGFGGPLDMTSDEARQGWRAKDRTIVKQGRYWLKGHGTGGGMFRLAEAIARPGCLVSEDAVPYLEHRGIIVAYGTAPSPERRSEAVAWWRDTHLVDLFTAPGVLAALRCDPVDAADPHVLHLILCEESPAVVMPRIETVLRYQGAMGRFPAFGGVYEPECFLPYAWIVPLEYDFDFDG